MHDGPNLRDAPDMPSSTTPHGTDGSPLPFEAVPVEAVPDEAVLDEGEEEYMSLFPSLVTSEEFKWFSEYSEYFIWRPRKIKRIINCYICFKCIEV